jgi:hypothetical protein
VHEIEEEQDIAIGAEAEGEFEFTSGSSDDDYHNPFLTSHLSHTTVRLAVLPP